MKRNALSGAAALAALSLLAAAGCSRPAAPPPAEIHGPATFQEAQVLAAQRNVPLLVDFWSPT